MGQINKTKNYQNDQQTIKFFSKLIRKALHDIFSDEKEYVLFFCAVFLMKISMKMQTLPMNLFMKLFS